MAEFIVESSLPLENWDVSKVAAIGRCGDCSIPIGTKFSVLRVGKSSREIELIVESIHAYGRSLTELSAGLTGCLVLCGQPGEVSNSILGTV